MATTNGLQDHWHNALVLLEKVLSQTNDLNAEAVFAKAKELNLVDPKLNIYELEKLYPVGHVVRKHCLQAGTVTLVDGKFHRVSQIVEVDAPVTPPVQAKIPTTVSKTEEPKSVTSAKPEETPQTPVIESTSEQPDPTGEDSPKKRGRQPRSP